MKLVLSLLGLSTHASAVLIQCPPADTLDTPVGLALGMSCGGTCGFKGTCATGFDCQKPCDDVPSASFVISELGAPEVEGICVTKVNSDQRIIPGGTMQKNVCDEAVQAAAKQAVEMIDAQSNSMNSIQLVQVVSASSQVVAGIKWILTLSAGVSSCAKSTAGKFSLCETPVDEKQRDLYQVTLLHQSWMTPRWTLAEFKILPRSTGMSSAARSTVFNEDGVASHNVKEGVKRLAPAEHAMLGGKGSIGPAWTYDPSVEKPAGTKNMGSWTEAVYTPEQQARLGVDASGNKAEAPKASVTATAASVDLSELPNDSHTRSGSSPTAVAGISTAAVVGVIALVGVAIVVRRKSAEAATMQARTRRGETVQTTTMDSPPYQSDYSVM